MMVQRGCQSTDSSFTLKVSNSTKRKLWCVKPVHDVALKVSGWRRFSGRDQSYKMPVITLKRNNLIYTDKLVFESTDSKKSEYL
jgi:hypothetical protein